MIDNPAFPDSFDDNFDYEAYRAEQERRHWQQLEAQEDDLEIQQYIDEYGDYPPDHWAFGQLPLDEDDYDLGVIYINEDGEFVHEGADVEMSEDVEETLDNLMDALAVVEELDTLSDERPWLILTSFAIRQLALYGGI